MVPNHEKKGDYYVNLYLSQLTNKLSLYKMMEREAFLMQPKHQSHLPNKENEFLVPNHEEKEITM